MPKMIVNIAIFGTFVLMILFLGFFLWQTLFVSEKKSQAQHQAEVTRNDQQPEKEGPFVSSATPRGHNPTEEAIAEYTKWLAIFTLFLVLATVGLFVSGERSVEVAGRSADAAKQSADVARDAIRLAEKTAERQLRAYIFIQATSFRFVKPNVGPIYVELVARNEGQTPASNATLHSLAYLIQHPLSDNYPFPQDVTAGDFIPGTEMDVRILEAQRKIKGQGQAIYPKEEVVFMARTHFEFDPAGIEEMKSGHGRRLTVLWSPIKTFSESNGTHGAV